MADASAPAVTAAASLVGLLLSVTKEQDNAAAAAEGGGGGAGGAGGAGCCWTSTAALGNPRPAITVSIVMKYSVVMSHASVPFCIGLVQNRERHQGVFYRGLRRRSRHDEARSQPGGSAIWYCEISHTICITFPTFGCTYACGCLLELRSSFRDAAEVVQYW